jgi:hypothetical protein
MSEAELPPDNEEDAPPWAPSPQLRRDLPPHRGHLLRVWSVVATVLSVLSMWFLVSAAFAVPLALLLWWAASHDLRKTRAGEMDPGGEGQAAAARTDALVCLVFPVIGCLFLAALYAILFHKL